MMTDAELNQLAEELSIDMMVAQAQKKLQSQKPVEKKPLELCPFCRSDNLRNSPCEGVKRCQSCRAYFGEKFNFQFPKWAQNPNHFFRRVFCLFFDIQLKPNLKEEQNNGQILPSGCVKKRKYVRKNKAILQPFLG